MINLLFEVYTIAFSNYVLDILSHRQHSFAVTPTSAQIWNLFIAPAFGDSQLGANNKSMI
jgi:hypothetical protein